MSRAENKPLDYDSLIAINSLVGLSDKHALNHLAQLIDLCDPVERASGLERAICWAEELAQRGLTGTQHATLSYFRSNIYATKLNHTARDKEALPENVQEQEGDGAYCKVRNTLVEAGADPAAEIYLELATVAAWCAAHGLAEMRGFAQFQRLKDAVGGEDAFLRAVFNHMGLSPGPHGD